MRQWMQRIVAADEYLNHQIAETHATIAESDLSWTENSKGHPLGATGLAQCSELTWQLRGEAAGRRADGVDLALQHNIGLGGAAVVTLYRRAT
jgi:hypothetical protein